MTHPDTPPTTLSWKTIGLAVVVAVLLSLPSLWIGFVFDDYPMVGVMEGWYDIEEPLNLYPTLQDIDVPWWKSGNSRLDFWRPLTSAVLRLNHALFGRHAVFYHAHYLLWLAGIVVLTALLYRRLSPHVALAAIFLFAIEEAHGLTSGIICNSHTVVSLLPSLGGLVAHLKWREDGWRPGLPLAVVGFAVGLCSSETALAVLAYPLAYEIFAASGHLVQRLRCIAPLATLTIVYVLFYKAMGFGPKGMSIYSNPLDEPAVFLGRLAAFLPVFLGNLIGALPTRHLIVPEFQGPFVLFSLAVTIIAAIALHRIWKTIDETDRKGLRWWLVGALGAILPASGAPPDVRQFLVPAIGFAPLIAVFGVTSWERWRDPSVVGFRRTSAAATVVVLLLLHGGVAAHTRLQQQFSVIDFRQTMEEIAASLEEIVPEASTDNPHRLFLIAGDGMLLARFPGVVYEMRNGAGTVTWKILSGALFEHRLERTGHRTVVLEPLDGQLLSSMFELLYRKADERLSAGDIVTDELFDVEVLDTNEVGPTRLAFHFKVDIEASDVTFLYWDGDRLQELQLPGVGTAVRIPAPEILWTP